MNVFDEIRVNNEFALKQQFRKLSKLCWIYNESFVNIMNVQMKVYDMSILINTKVVIWTNSTQLVIRILITHLMYLTKKNSKTFRLRDFSTFIYEPILIKMSMNDKIIKTQIK